MRPSIKALLWCAFQLWAVVITGFGIAASAANGNPWAGTILIVCLFGQITGALASAVDLYLEVTTEREQAQRDAASNQGVET